MLKLYNTLTRKKEEFKPINPPQVGLYTCGPTVYNYPHIGNYRAYILGDILKRYLKYIGYEIKHVMNLTDVDDKTIHNSQKAGKSLKEFTDFYAEAFFEDLNKLNIEPADVYPRATEHIKEMTNIIEKLLENNLAYKGKDGSIYYEIRNFDDYGKLSRVKITSLQKDASGRIKSDEYDKDHVEDFALWKAWNKEDGDVFWDPSTWLGTKTSISKGRPGWHIECSAMSMKYLGESFDIHTGAVDLIFPHHENEIAQSEGSTGKPFVKYFLHNEWLLVDGKKMSKSLGNFYTLQDIEEKSYSPFSYRYFVLGTHYRKQTNFTWEALKSAQNALDRLEDFFLDLGLPAQAGTNEGKINNEYQKRFKKHMDDDLDTPGALSVLWDLIHDQNVSKEDKQSTILDFDKVFGLGFEKLKPIEVPARIKKLVEQREEARKKEDWQKADQIREEIKKQGFKIRDTEEGPRISL